MSVSKIRLFDYDFLRMEEDVLTHLVILDLNTLSHDEILDNQEYVIKFYGNTPDNINTTHDILYID